MIEYNEKIQSQYKQSQINLETISKEFGLLQELNSEISKKCVFYQSENQNLMAEIEAMREAQVVVREEISDEDQEGTEEIEAIEGIPEKFVSFGGNNQKSEGRESEDPE